MDNKYNVLLSEKYFPIYESMVNYSKLSDKQIEMLERAMNKDLCNKEQYESAMFFIENLFGIFGNRYTKNCLNNWEKEVLSGMISTAKYGLTIKQYNLIEKIWNSRIEKTENK